MKDVAQMRTELKEKFGDSIELQIAGDVVFLKKPSRAVVSMSITKAATDPLAQSDVLIENCYIGGTLSKEDVLNDVGLLLGIQSKVTSIIGMKTVEIKNS